MKKNVILLVTLAFTPLAQQAMSGTHEMSAGYGHNKIKNTLTMNGFQSDTDLKSDNFSINYSLYSTNLKDKQNPELAILKTHPSFLRLGYSSSESKLENNPSLESKNYSAEGRYSFINGIGLGGGLNYSDIDYVATNPNMDTERYDTFISLDYSASENSNASLVLHRITADGENSSFDSDGYGIDGSLKFVVNNFYVFNPSIAYAEEDYDGQNVMDWESYQLGIDVGFLFNENLSVFVGGNFNKTRYEDKSDYNSHRIFVHPKYWFNKNININVMFDYQESESETGQNIQFESKGYSGNVFCTYRF